MTSSRRWLFLLSVALLASVALGQRRGLPPPGIRNGIIRPQAKGVPPPVSNGDPIDAADGGSGSSGPGIAKVTTTDANGKPLDNKTKSCDELRRKARFGVYFKAVDIADLVQTVSNATCKTFILGDNIRGKISIMGPENGKGEVDSEEFYAAFLAALDANNLTVYPYGKFMKIVEKNRAKQSTLPTYVTDGEGVEYTTNEQMITKLIKLKYAELEPVRGVLQNLVSQGGDTIPYPPDTIIVNDLGSNIHRLEKIVEQLDTKSSSDEIRVIKARYASASDLAQTIQKLFENKGAKPATRGGVTPVNPITPPNGAPPSTPSAGSEGASSGPVTLSQVIPDERTNKLIIVASPAAFSRIESLVQELDVPISGEGRINVYPLSNANAEDLSSTLQSLAQGTTNRPRAGGAGGAPGGGLGGGAPRPAGSSGAPGAGAAELFGGEVKISPDKSTNSLVIMASQNDYRSLVRVIEKLDLPRRQVFVEAVIMEVNLDRDNKFGINLHQGVPLSTPEGAAPAVIGTSLGTTGLPPSLSLANLANFGGLLAGIQGKATGVTVAGVTIPSFGIILHALQTSSDVNVLSTPHILTSDNEDAEITVGQNVPFQAGYSPTSLASSLTGAAGAAGAAGASAGLLGGLGGLGSYIAPINRQNVELKLTIKPQINDGDNIRLVINEQTEDIASTDPVLGPTTSKRTAKTTVVAKDQTTVVIGGIYQERTTLSVNKVPVLGDIPVIGELFRDKETHKIKTNLLVFLTPYIIRDQEDFRRIFERKMAERQQFVEQFYGENGNYDVPVDFTRKAGPLAKMNQAVLREQGKLENGGPGQGTEQMIKPGGAAVPTTGGAAPLSPTRSAPPSALDAAPSGPRGVLGSNPSPNPSTPPPAEPAGGGTGGMDGPPPTPANIEPVKPSPAPPPADSRPDLRDSPPTGDGSVPP